MRECESHSKVMAHHASVDNQCTTYSIELPFFLSSRFTDTSAICIIVSLYSDSQNNVMKREKVPYASTVDLLELEYV